MFQSNITPNYNFIILDISWLGLNLTATNITSWLNILWIILKFQNFLIHPFVICICSNLTYFWLHSVIHCYRPDFVSDSFDIPRPPKKKSVDLLWNITSLYWSCLYIITYHQLYPDFLQQEGWELSKLSDVKGKFPLPLMKVLALVSAHTRILYGIIGPSEVRATIEQT